MTKDKLIKLYSKDKKSLERFVHILKKMDNDWKILTFASKNIKRKIKKVTVLKSPHVNKKAQTQFQSITYSTLIKYSTWEIKKNYILLKKIRNHLFPGIKIKIEQTVFTKKTKALSKNQFLPQKTYFYMSTNTFLEKQKPKNSLLTFSNDNKKKILLQKTLQFLKILDNYGNLN